MVVVVNRLKYFVKMPIDIVILWKDSNYFIKKFMQSTSFSSSFIWDNLPQK